MLHVYLLLAGAPNLTSRPPAAETIYIYIYTTI